MAAGPELAPAASMMPKEEIDEAVLTKSSLELVARDNNNKLILPDGVTDLVSPSDNGAVHATNCSLTFSCGCRGRDVGPACQFSFHRIRRRSRSDGAGSLMEFACVLMRRSPECTSRRKIEGAMKTCLVTPPST